MVVGRPILHPRDPFGPFRVPLGGTPFPLVLPDYPAGVSVYAVAEAPEVRIRVADLGLACCAVEFAAAVAQGLLVPVGPDADAGATSILVISGTVTDALAPAVRAAWEALPEPKAALSFGACSNSGGPYWDSYAVTKGVDQVIPVHTYVPGCLPRPEALIDALMSLAVPA